MNTTNNLTALPHPRPLRSCLHTIILHSVAHKHCLHGDVQLMRPRIFSSNRATTTPPPNNYSTVVHPQSNKMRANDDNRRGTSKHLKATSSRATTTFGATTPGGTIFEATTFVCPKPTRTTHTHPLFTQNNHGGINARIPPSRQKTDQTIDHTRQQNVHVDDSAAAASFGIRTPAEFHGKKTPTRRRPPTRE